MLCFLLTVIMFEHLMSQLLHPSTLVVVAPPKGQSHGDRRTGPSLRGVFPTGETLALFDLERTKENSITYLRFIWGLCMFMLPL